MSEAKHTPGPWRYVYAPGYCGELRAQNGTTIAEFVTEPNSDNACLIAAAPELLEYLQYAVWAHPELAKNEKLMAVIAKATGQEEGQ